jgi:hypothetical protein
MIPTDRRLTLAVPRASTEAIANKSASWMAKIIISRPPVTLT